VGFRRLLKVSFVFTPSLYIIIFWAYFIEMYTSCLNVYLCIYVSLLEVLTGVVPLTLVGFSFERVRSLPRIRHVECYLPIWEVLFLTWGIARILAFPRFFAYGYFQKGVIMEDDDSNSNLAHNGPDKLALNQHLNLNFSEPFPDSSECRKVCGI